MEYSILSVVIDELAAVLPGSRVNKVVPTGDESVVLLLRQKGKDHVLLLAPARNLPRIHLLCRKPAASAPPDSFHLSLRKYLTGCTFAGIRLVNQDRVVEMRFSRPGEELLLVVELFGASGNMLLTDGGRKIISVLRPVPPGDRIDRPLVSGIVYEPPAVRPLLTRKAPSGAQERAEMTVPLSALSQNRAAEAMFEQLIEEREQARLRQSVVTSLRRALARTTRRIEAVQEDLEAAERGGEHRRNGDLILANLPLLERGQEQADLPDQEGALHRVQLDPSRTPTENAERYFRRYKKAKAGLAVLRERLEEALAEREFLEDVGRDVDAAAGLDAFGAVRETLTKRGLLREEGGRPVRAVRSAPPYRSVSYEGWEILIGRSAAGNDYVTTQLSRPDDLWLHAEGMPGSHVLVRNPRKSDIPPAVLRKAAALAARYSKGKGSAKIAVAYTAAKYVKKPKGAAPGTVLLRERKTIMAAPEADEGR